MFVNQGLTTEALVKCVSLEVAKPDCCATDGKLHQLTWAGRFRTPADGSGWEGGLNCFASMALSLAKLSQLPHRWPRALECWRMCLRIKEEYVDLLLCCLGFGQGPTTWLGLFSVLLRRGGDIVPLRLPISFTRWGKPGLWKRQNLQ